MSHGDVQNTAIPMNVVMNRYFMYLNTTMRAFENWNLEHKMLHAAIRLPATLISNFLLWLNDQYNYSRCESYALEIASEYLGNLSNDILNIDECQRLFHDKIMNFIKCDKIKCKFRSFMNDKFETCSIAREHHGPVSSYCEYLIDKYCAKGELHKAYGIAEHVAKTVLEYVIRRHTIIETYEDVVKKYETNGFGLLKFREMRYTLWDCGLCAVDDMFTECFLKHCKTRHNQIVGKVHVHIRCLDLMDLYENACQEFEARYNAAVVIQKTWRHAISCPNYQVCKRRLIREVAELISNC